MVEFLAEFLVEFLAEFFVEFLAEFLTEFLAKLLAEFLTKCFAKLLIDFLAEILAKFSAEFLLRYRESLTGWQKRLGTVSARFVADPFPSAAGQLPRIGAREIALDLDLIRVIGRFDPRPRRRYRRSAPHS